MARITQQEAQAWVESTKFTIPNITQPPNSDLLPQLEEEVLAQIGGSYDTSGWTNETNTPRLVRVIIAKLFVAWAYRRQYSESILDNDAQYAIQLETNAGTLIAGIIEGTIKIPGPPDNTSQNSPSFYPNDASSMSQPTVDDPSLGPAAFSMGTVF